MTRSRLQSSAMVFLIYFGFGGAASLAEDQITIESLLSIPNQPESQTTELSQLRISSMRDSAIAYGAQGGMISTTLKNQGSLGAHSVAQKLNDTFSFRELLVEGPSSVLVMPPVITRTEANVRFSDDGASVTMADVEYVMVQPAQLLSVPPTWRTYLFRDPGELVPPSAANLPKNKEERRMWSEWVRQGWQAGVAQSEAIFRTDLARLERDFYGVILYQKLVLEGKVSELHVALGRNGLVLDEDKMRLGDRWVEITQHASFNGETSDWTPLVISREPAIPIRRSEP